MSTRKLIQLTKYVDHTNLSPTAKNYDIRKLCAEAAKYDFKSVCVHPSKIRLCVSELADSDVLICTVVGFPLGQNSIASKVYETIDAIKQGANEIDMVINIAELKSRNKKYCIDEINQVVDAANGRAVKVIVETCLLDEDEKIFAFDVVHNSKAHYIKTSTGFSTGGAKLDDIKLWNDLRSVYGSDLKIKAAGGITSYDDLIDFLQYGANRIGTSKGVQLFQNKSKITYANLVTYLSIREGDKRKGVVVEKLPSANKVNLEPKESSSDKKADTKQEQDSKEDTKVETKDDSKESDTSKVVTSTKKSKKKRKPVTLDSGY